MSTPTYDEQCRPLLPDEEFHRINILETEEFEQLPDDVKERYGHTYEWHFHRRIGNTVPESIQTGSAMTYREVLEQRQRAKTQTGSSGVEAGIERKWPGPDEEPGRPATEVSPPV